jgi:hypothetical protein
MFAEPAATPVTRPEDAVTVATDVLSLIQIPSGVASASVVVRPSHTFIVPVITAGNGFTVATTVEIQPVGSI